MWLSPLGPQRKLTYLDINTVIASFTLSFKHWAMFSLVLQKIDCLLYLKTKQNMKTYLDFIPK